MKEYEIYDPPGFCLPALKIKKRQYRKNIENDSKVNNFIKSKLLLNPEFNSLYLNIFKKSRCYYNFAPGIFTITGIYRNTVGDKNSTYSFRYYPRIWFWRRYWSGKDHVQSWHSRCSGYVQSSTSKW